MVEHPVRPTELLLGRFDYHTFFVQLTCLSDESLFKLRVFDGETGEVDYADLHAARLAFESTCRYVMYKTSYTMISHYMQFEARPVEK